MPLPAHAQIMLSGAKSAEVFTSATLKRAGTAAGASALANITFSDAASEALPEVSRAARRRPAGRPPLLLPPRCFRRHSP